MAKYRDTCPPCGTVFSGDDRDAVADAVVEHARTAHDHELTREHVLAHLDGKDPHRAENGE